MCESVRIFLPHCIYLFFTKGIPSWEMCNSKLLWSVTLQLFRCADGRACIWLFCNWKLFLRCFVTIQFKLDDFKWASNCCFGGVNIHLFYSCDNCSKTGIRDKAKTGDMLWKVSDLFSESRIRQHKKYLNLKSITKQGICRCWSALELCQCLEIHNYTSLHNYTKNE